MATGRRFLGTVPRLTRRPWEDVASQLEDFLRRLWDSEADGIPAGFGDVVPQTVEAATGTVTGSPGTENQGWAAADHDHVASTGSAVALDPSSVNGEGVSSALARADHTHDTSALVDESMIFAIIFGK